MPLLTVVSVAAVEVHLSQVTQALLPALDVLEALEAAQYGIHIYHTPNMLLIDV